MNECFGEYFILNGSLMPSVTFDDSLIYEGESVYEVLKSVNGLPVFFSDHIERLLRSVNVSGRHMLTDFNALKVDILKLTSAEKREMINIKIVFNYNEGRNNVLLYYLEPRYPAKDDYRSGVKGILYPAERKDPESKVIDMPLRSEINKRLSREKGYEVLLVNRNSCITEGSRTNIFFILDNCLVTAPDKLILSGITRKKVIEICNENSIPVIYECIKADEIEKYECVFMTGTSPVVLPFSYINNIKFKVNHPYIANLRDLYLGKAEESMKKFSIFDTIH